MPYVPGRVRAPALRLSDRPAPVTRVPAQVTRVSAQVARPWAARVSPVRAAVACAAAAIALAGCGAPPTTAVEPGPAPDLFLALPATPSATPAPTTAPAPTMTKPAPAPATTTTKPAAKKPAATKPAATKPAGGEADPGAGAGWAQSGGDDFGGGAIDGGTWELYDGVGGFGNGVRSPEAVSQSDGTLKVTGRGEVSGGLSHTLGQLYGRWEFRARTDAGRGFGSAILLWPDSEQWPRDGELDIMEVPFETRDLAHFVVHWGTDGNDNIHGGSVPGDYTQWHTFAIEWLPDRITWYVDGKKRYETREVERIPTTPMHLAIQLDQGPKKDWLPARDETTPAEVNLEVDWVKVYAAG